MSNGPAPGHVIFYEHCATPLSAGAGYSLEVGQELDNVDTTAAELPPARKHEFEIAGPRFTINPSEIHAAYPPPNSQGPFESRLPMIVLQRRTLPWERIADSFARTHSRRGQLASIFAQPFRAIRSAPQPGRDCGKPVDVPERYGGLACADRDIPRRGSCRFCR